MRVATLLPLAYKIVAAADERGRFEPELRLVLLRIKGGETATPVAETITSFLEKLSSDRRFVEAAVLALLQAVEAADTGSVRAAALARDAILHSVCYALEYNRKMLQMQADVVRDCVPCPYA